MPSFINVGAYVDEGSMIDTWASVGSCVQVGKIVIYQAEPELVEFLTKQANPTIVEDNCFVGARSEIAEGVIVEKGSVLSMGVYIGASTRIIDRATGKIHYGKFLHTLWLYRSMPSKNNPDGPSLYCSHC